MNNFISNKDREIEQIMILSPNKDKQELERLSGEHISQILKALEDYVSFCKETYGLVHIFEDTE